MPSLLDELRERLRKLEAARAAQPVGTRVLNALTTLDTSPRMNAAPKPTMYQEGLEALKRAGRSFMQQPVVRAAGMVADQIDQGFRGNIGQEDLQIPGGGVIPAEGQQVAATVYHGSPHTFDKFDMSKVGTGEGAQAYGHGLYFAENPSVAQSYRPSQNIPMPVETRAVLNETSYLGFDTPGQAIQAIRQHPDWKTRWDVSDLPPERVALLEEHANRTRGGGLYKVDLPDEAIAKMLDWDAPLSQQPEAVRGLFPIGKDGRVALPNGERVSPERLRGETIYRALSEAQHGDVSAASSFFRERGIPGIKYYDAGSRGSGQGTRNFVSFDDELPRILGVER